MAVMPAKNGIRRNHLFIRFVSMTGQRTLAFNPPLICLYFNLNTKTHYKRRGVLGTCKFCIFNPQSFFLALEISFRASVSVLLFVDHHLG